MIMPISHIAPLERLTQSPITQGPQAAKGSEAVFERMVQQVLGGASAADAQATQAVQDLATGEADDIHTAALSIAQADISFRLALSIRNRLLDAYQEVIRMQV
jgi:flagellar hook-basal body complex protein FliE